MSNIDPITEHILNEAPKRTTRTTVHRTTKIKRATGQLASIEARRRNDPIYKRMVKYRDLYFKYREMLHKKYGPRVRSKARR
ncbi:MAG: hypothetical protein ACFFG0_00210 [Candidatus Thorarchaeota archaeon]